MKCFVRCRVCGNKFEGNSGRACYCSDYCKEIGYKAVKNANSRAKYVHKSHMRELVCKLCGEKYTGHFNSKYCEDCINSGVGRLAEYNRNRKSRKGGG